MVLHQDSACYIMVVSDIEKGIENNHLRMPQISTLDVWISTYNATYILVSQSTINSRWTQLWPRNGG